MFHISLNNNFCTKILTYTLKEHHEDRDGHVVLFSPFGVSQQLLAIIFATIIIITLFKVD